MSDHRPHAPDLGPDPFHRPPGYERRLDRDIDVRGISWTVLGILVLTVVSMVAMWGLLIYLQGYAERTAPEVPAIRLQAADEPAPGPRLQASPERELLDMRAEEDEILSTYGAVEGADGAVRVPIERAMEMLAAGRAAGPTDLPAADGVEAEMPAAAATPQVGAVEATAPPAAAEPTP